MEWLYTILPAYTTYYLFDRAPLLSPDAISRPGTTIERRLGAVWFSLAEAIAGSDSSGAQYGGSRRQKGLDPKTKLSRSGATFLGILVREPAGSPMSTLGKKLVQAEKGAMFETARSAGVYVCPSRYTGRLFKCRALPILVANITATKACLALPLCSSLSAPPSDRDKKAFCLVSKCLHTLPPSSWLYSRATGSGAPKASDTIPLAHVSQKTRRDLCHTEMASH